MAHPERQIDNLLKSLHKSSSFRDIFSGMPKRDDERPPARAGRQQTLDAQSEPDPLDALVQDLVALGARTATRGSALRGHWPNTDVPEMRTTSSTDARHVAFAPNAAVREFLAHGER
ncbi:hypothetical protein KFE25_004713 [Diacronema lutheri]|uniref:Uncharacterized protein n=1 Tax=Diacronema lutheri TaxID=2081491 RepID=A0A8J5XJX7_DIALT|nr:hypothetical protein KFE25_004713 [Diacronema lutheri]